MTGHATAVLDAAGAGILLDDGEGELGFVAASEERVTQAELHQQQVDSGACYEAYASNAVVVVDDLATAGRWPEYTDRVVGLGLRSVIGIPLNASGRTIGVMNVYREEPGPWSTEDVVTAELLATMGAGYILNASQMRAQQTLTEQLQAAVESRDIIGQAKGILMAREDVDADRAFELLRQASQDSNLKLREVAEAVCARYRSAGEGADRRSTG